MPTIKISLDSETYASLSSIAVRERRHIPGQTFVLLRQSLGLPFPLEANTDKPLAQATEDHTA
jgi:hypothetical protein